MSYVLFMLAWFTIVFGIGYFSSNKTPPPPYRVAKNALGEFVLQRYQIVTSTAMCNEENPLREQLYKCDYVTIGVFNTFDEAVTVYKQLMSDLSKAEIEQHKQEQQQLTVAQQKQLKNTIVKVYKIK